MEVEIEKRVHYLKGILTGIQYGASAPNVFRYKQQIDYELKALEAKLMAKSKGPVAVPVPVQSRNHLAHMVKEVSVDAQEEVEVEVEVEDPAKKKQRVALAFVEVSRRINALREQVHIHNNTIHTLMRKSTLQNGTRAQQLHRQVVIMQAEIQQLQMRYNTLEAYLKNDSMQTLSQSTSSTTSSSSSRSTRRATPPLRTKPASASASASATAPTPVPTTTFTPKSILKKKIISGEDDEDCDFEVRPRERRININTDANQVTEIPALSTPIAKKRLVLTQKPVEEARSKTMENEDADMIRELQSTLGSIQKLLI